MLIRLNDGEDITVYSRESKNIVVIKAIGYVLGTRSFNKTNDMDINLGFNKK